MNENYPAVKIRLDLRRLTCRSLYVWRRNIDVNLLTWKTNVAPSLLEPLLYILAFGVGLGAYVQKINFQGALYGYLAFIAPGMVAAGIMFHSIFDTMYGSFVRMRYQKTFDALVATPLSVEDILAGEILFGATKGVFAGAAVLLVISLFGLASYPQSLVILPAGLVAGVMFAAFGLWFSALAPFIDNLNLPVFLFVNPQFLFSGTFFPLDSMPGWLRLLSKALPLTPLVEISRAATLGRLSPRLFLDFAYLTALALFASCAAMRTMKRRLVK